MAVPSASAVSAVCPCPTVRVRQLIWRQVHLARASWSTCLVCHSLAALLFVCFARKFCFRCVFCLLRHTSGQFSVFPFRLEVDPQNFSGATPRETCSSLPTPFTSDLPKSNLFYREKIWHGQISRWFKVLKEWKLPHASHPFLVTYAIYFKWRHFQF